MSTTVKSGTGLSGANAAAAAGLTAAPRSVSNYNIDVAIAGLYSTSASDVVKALNFLIAKTSDLQNDGSSIQFEVSPNLLTALADLLDVINPIGNIIFQENPPIIPLNPESIIDGVFDVPFSNDLHYKSLLGYDNHEFKFLARYLDDNQLLLSLLGVIRNLGVESTNESFLAYHTTILRHLVSIVEAAMVTGKILEATQLALDTLIFIGGKIDISGSKRLLSSSSYFLEDLPTDPIGGALLRLRMTPAMSSNTSELYERITNELMQVIFLMIDHESTHSRFCVMKGLELLSKLIQCNENKNYFSKLPAEVMGSLFRLLYVQVTHTESLVPEVFSLMGDPMGRSRPPYIPAITNTQGDTVLTLFHDQVDLELRDMALNEIRALCQISKNNASNLLDSRNAVDLIFQIANLRGSGNIPTVGIRNECSAKAINILSVLATMPEAVPFFQALRTEIIASGCSDYSVAEIMCNQVMDLMFPGAVFHPGITGIPM